MQQLLEEDSHLRIALLGGKGVGKTSLLVRCAKDTFDNEVPPVETVLETRLLDIALDDGNTCRVEFVDIGGAEMYDTLRANVYPTCHAFLIVAAGHISDDVDTEPYSLWHDVKQYLTIIREHAVYARVSQCAMALLVVNKCDLTEQGRSSATGSRLHSPSDDALHTFVLANQPVLSFRYRMVSARFGTEVQEAFKDVIALAFNVRACMHRHCASPQLTLPLSQNRSVGATPLSTSRDRASRLMQFRRRTQSFSGAPVTLTVPQVDHAQPLYSDRMQRASSASSTSKRLLRVSDSSSAPSLNTRAAAAGSAAATASNSGSESSSYIDGASSTVTHRKQRQSTSANSDLSAHPSVEDMVAHAKGDHPQCVLQ